MAIKNSEHRKIAAAAKAGGVKEVADPEGKIKGTETERNQDKRIEKINPAPKRIEPEEDSATGIKRYERVPPQEEYQVLEERTLIL